MLSIKKFMFCVLLASTVFSGIYLTVDILNDKPIPEFQDKNSISTQSEKYTVKHFNGKISVFVGDNTEPLYTLDSPYVRDLPEYDRELLETGIVANSEEELIKILEDYDG